MSNLKVALLKSQAGKIGGLEKYTWKLADAFVRKSCSVTLLTTGSLDAIAADKSLLTTISFPIPSKPSIFHLLRYDEACREWLKNNQVDVVFGMDRNRFQTHYRAGSGVHAQYLAQRKLKSSLIKRLSFAVNPLHRSLLRLERMTYEHPDLRYLFTNSYMVKNEILSRYRTPENKIQVVHNGVEWKAMEESFNEWAQQRPQLLAERGLDPSCFQLLFVGQGFRRKGLVELLRAIALLHDKTIQLSVVGEDKERFLCQKETRRLGLERQVHFFGLQKQVTPFYQFADALAIPSYYDPFANVTLEALTMGLHVLSSKHNGGHEVLNEGAGTLIDDLTDLDSLVAGLNQCSG